MTENKTIKAILKYVNKLLLPLDKHYYHHYGHALDVMERAVYLWKKESVSDENLEMLAIAAIFHDTGFIIQYDKNEPIWAKIAQNYLKTILYPEEKIKIIREIILATDPDYKNPKNILEKIIKDADMDNLGRDDFFDKWEKLKHEIEVIKNIKIKNPDWHHSSLDLLYEHNFLTNTWKDERWNKLEENKKELEKMMKELDDMEYKKYEIEM